MYVIYIYIYIYIHIERERERDVLEEPCAIADFAVDAALQGRRGLDHDSNT